MTNIPAKNTMLKALRSLALLGVFCLPVVLPAGLPQEASAATHAADNFDRANSNSLGANWSAIRDGGLSISSHAVTGRVGLAGDIWTAGAFTSDQYSQIEVTSKRLTGGQWIGAAVRAQNGGRDAYAGIYFWNSGSPELDLFKRSQGNWVQLGTYHSGPLAGGTELRLMATGSTISFLENGIPRLSVSDSSFSGGGPGIMINGAGTAGKWLGGRAPGNAGFQVNYISTDTSGVRSYQVLSADNGPGLQVMRVLTPTHPAPGVPHNFLYVLPVQPGLNSTFGDGLETLQRLDAQDQYNLTIIEPTFAIDPWYANNPENANVQYETFVTREVVPWVEKNLSITGHDQNILLSCLLGHGKNNAL